MAKCVAAAKGAPLYRLECYKSIGKREALYCWDERLQEIELKRQVECFGDLPEDAASVIYQSRMMVPGVLTRALRNPHPDVFVLINELDKIPDQEAFEALLLEYLDEHAITVHETGERIGPASERPPHTVITSNAGVNGSSLRDSLSYPVLRRGKYVYLPEADRDRRYAILRDAGITDCSDCGHRLWDAGWLRFGMGRHRANGTSENLYSIASQNPFKGGGECSYTL